jgi:glycosyltransferase involved in cell wall biosynthesis
MRGALQSSFAETIRRQDTDVSKQPPKPREYLIDVSRVIWRCWSGRLPTGIDRVCLAYLEYFGDRAQAVIQRGGQHFILSPRGSDRLFQLLLARRPATRLNLARCLAMSIIGFRRPPHRPGLVYLNVGHTGLDEQSLPDWVRRHRLRAVYLVHDLIPLTHPQFCRTGELERHARRMENVLASATGIIGNSQATLAELETYARSQGRSLPRTVAAWISGAKPPARTDKPPLDTPYFVVVGTVEGRKNHQLLLDIWAELLAERGRDTPTLVVIGQRGWQAETAVAQLDRPEDFLSRVRHIDRGDDAELAAWLRGARALLMPSFAEGFGLPVIEALELGCPVIASDLPVFREIAGGIPTFLGPLDATGWKRTITTFIGDGPERTRQLAALPSFRAPSWAKHFAIVDRWLTTL